MINYTYETKKNLDMEVLHGYSHRQQGFSLGEE